MLEQILRILKRRTLSREIKDDVAIEEENAEKHSGQVTGSACPVLVLLKTGYWIAFSLTYSPFSIQMLWAYMSLQLFQPWKHQHRKSSARVMEETRKSKRTEQQTSFKYYIPLSSL